MADYAWFPPLLPSLTILTASCASILFLRITHRKANRSQTLDKAAVYGRGLELRVMTADMRGLEGERQGQVVSWGVGEVGAAIRDGEITCEEVVRAFGREVQRKGITLHAITDERLETALEEARALDKQLADGRKPGPLFGIPFSVKDNISVKDFCTSHGLARLCYNKLSSDSLIIEVLRRHGAIPIVRSSMAQLGASCETINYLVGTCDNPLRPGRSAGGSSGGECALISSHCVLFGLGGDVGGSIRIPAAFTGLVGLRPTSNRVSSKGPVAKGGWPGLPSSWGPMAHTVSDMEKVMEVICSPEVYQEDPLVPPVPWRMPEVKRLRIGYVTGDPFAPPCQASARALLESVSILESQGHILSPFTLPDLRSAFELFLRFFLSTVSYLEMFFDWESPITTLKNAMVSYRTPSIIRKLLFWYYQHESPPLPNSPFSAGPKGPSVFGDQLAELKAYKKKFNEAWVNANVDVVIVPFPVPAGPHTHDYDESRALVWTALFNVVDYPAGTVPITTIKPEECHYSGPSFDETQRINKILEGSAGLPMSVQVVARPYHEELCLTVMRVLESSRS